MAFAQSHHRPIHLTRGTVSALLAAVAILAPSAGRAGAAGVSPRPAKAIGAGDLILSLVLGKDAVAEYTPAGKHVQDLITLSNGLLGPAGSAFDKNGNLFVTDFYGNQVFERTTTGKVFVFSNNAKLGNGHVYNSPESVAFSPDGTKLYISDANRDGVGGGINVVDAATGKGVGFLPLPSSHGSKGVGESDWLGFDQAGTLYVTNENVKQGLMQVDLKTGNVVQPSFAPNVGGYPYAFGFDKAGNVWLAATYNIQEYSPQGKRLRTVTNPKIPLLEAFSAVFDPSATVFYVGDLLTSYVFTYNLNGQLTHSFQIPFAEPSGISVYQGFVP